MSAIGQLLSCPGVVYASFATQQKMAKELNMSLPEFKYQLAKKILEVVSSKNLSQLLN